VLRRKHPLIINSNERTEFISRADKRQMLETGLKSDFQQFK